MFLTWRFVMSVYEALALSYDRLTNDVDYEATVSFYEEILAREEVSPRSAADLACGTGSVTALLAKKGMLRPKLAIPKEIRQKLTAQKE